MPVSTGRKNSQVKSYIKVTRPGVSWIGGYISDLGTGLLCQTCDKETKSETRYRTLGRRDAVTRLLFQSDMGL